MTNKSEKPSAEALLEQERALVKSARVGAAKSLWIGIGLCVIGLVVTIASYNAASGGGKYLFAWGPILFGAIYFVRGLFHYLSPHTVLRKAFGSAGKTHTFYLEKTGQPVRAAVIVICVVIGVTIVLAMIGSGMSSSGDNTTSKQSAESTRLETQYDTCIEAFDIIKADLSDINQNMDDYSAAGQTSLYNSHVDKQNKLVADYNAKHDECESYRTQYNDSLKN